MYIRKKSVYFNVYTYAIFNIDTHIEVHIAYLPREAVDATSLEAFRIELNGALRNMM